jgi:hypothetical protein
VFTRSSRTRELITRSKSSAANSRMNSNLMGKSAWAATSHAWRRWKFDWLTPKEAGQYTLLARAKDADGLIQPDKHDQNYVINYPLPIDVFVDGSGGTV